MTVHIPIRLLPILRQVLRDRCPSIQSALQSGGSLVLNSEQSLELRQALTDELCNTGLTDDDEPNARGHDIEQLIDLAGRAAGIGS